MLIADCLTDTQSAALAALPTKREAQPMTKRDVRDKRQALIERDGHTDFKGQRCSPCSMCGRVFVATSLRTLSGPGAVALVCRRCKGEHVG